MKCRKAAGQSVASVAQKDLSHWPDWPTFPVDAAHAAGCELVMLGYVIWPDTVAPDSLFGDGPVPQTPPWSTSEAAADWPMQYEGDDDSSAVERGCPASAARSRACRVSAPTRVCCRRFRRLSWVRSTLRWAWRRPSPRRSSLVT